MLEFRCRRAPQLVGPKAPTSNTTLPFEQFALGINKAGTHPGATIMVVARVGLPPVFMSGHTVEFWDSRPHSGGV